MFNESFVFEIPAGTEEIQNISLEFLLLDWDRVTKNEVRNNVIMALKYFERGKYRGKTYTYFANNFVLLC